MLFSCTKKETYEAIYDKKGNKIVQLIQKDENNKNAYLAIFSNLEKNHILKISEDIARKYNIEGYNMFFGDSLYYLKQNIENKMLETFSDIHIVPYQYRTTYIYEKDTIMKIIKRNELDGWCGDVVTNKKYNRQDTALLRKALEYLNITDAYIYDFIPSKTYATSDDLICVYSHYNGSSKTFFFWDEANGENKFIINGKHVLKCGEDKLFTKYRTDKFLTNKEILQIKQEKSSARRKTVVYFYPPYEYEKDYASVTYNEKKNEYTIFMFNERKTYTYDNSLNIWSYSNHN